MEMEVHIYNHVERCYKSSLLEMMGSRVLAELLQSLKICDSCTNPISIIIDDEEKDTIISTLSPLSVGKKGLNIIQDSQKFKALSERLGVFVENKGDVVDNSNSFVTQQFDDHEEDDNNNYENDGNNNYEDGQFHAVTFYFSGAPPQNWKKCQNLSKHI